MQEIQNHIRPELLIVVAVLYFLGMMIKNTEWINDKHIPIILGAIGIFICSLYVLGIEGISVIGLFTGMTQGIITAGTAVYANQIIKQSTKE